MPATRSLHRLAIAVLVGLAASACVDEKIVYRDRELFEDLPPGAADFVGYTDEEAKLTVCGNCHVGQQTKWQNTAHAGAWEDLQESGHAAATCEGCHSVSDKGNPATGAVAYDATKDARYHDVQCESCHGPGFEHLQDPAVVQPYAHLGLGEDQAGGCGECHSGTHHPFAEEWGSSRHANTENHAAENASCVACHEARGILAAWGVTSNYADKNDPEVIPITCGVCHDPHGSPNSKQLRFPINVADIEQNLCMKCHLRRSEPDPSSSRGPHAPQGPLLIGQAVGWRPPNFQYSDAITGTHGSAANPRLCAGCHVSRFEVADPATGNFLFQATGHVFKGIPCIDAQGIPTGEEECALTERSFKACTVSGCHGSDSSARAALVAVWARFDLLGSTITSMLAKVPSTEFKTGDGLITTAEGARFNRDMATGFKGTAAHNPFLMEALLTASIKQMQTQYGITAPAGVDLNNTLSPTTSN